MCSRIELTNGTGSLLVTGSGQNTAFRFAFINIMVSNFNVFVIVFPINDCAHVVRTNQIM